MMAANSTKRLHKLSEAKQEQAKEGNTRDHMQNAAVWALELRRQNDLDEENPAPKRVRTKQKRKGNPHTLETSRS